jgi:DNA-binding MarR family transcriptional regulator
VRRTGDPNDRRTTLAEITPEGRAVVEEATAAVTRCQFGLEMLRDTELREVSDILFRVRLAAGDFRLDQSGERDGGRAGVPRPPTSL